MHKVILYLCDLLRLNMQKLLMRAHQCLSLGMFFWLQNHLLRRNHCEINTKHEATAIIFSSKMNNDSTLCQSIISKQCVAVGYQFDVSLKLKSIV